MNVFKITYSWYEDDHGETLVAKTVEREEFEKDLKSAVDFAKSIQGIEIGMGEEHLGKGYAVGCLPEYYEQVIWYLATKLGYVEINFDQTIHYDIDDDYEKNIKAIKTSEKIERVDL